MKVYMQVTYVNKDDRGIRLTLNKEYGMLYCIIHSWSSRVYLINDRGEKYDYPSILFDEKFQSELDEAIKELRNRKYAVGDMYNGFIKDFH